MPWFHIVPHVSGVNEANLRSVYTPLVDKLKEIGLIQASENGQPAGQYLRYATTLTHGSAPVNLFFGLNTSPPYTPIIQVNALHTFSVGIPNFSATITHITFYVDEINRMLVIGVYSNNSSLVPLIVWWEPTAKQLNKNVLVGPIYGSNLGASNGIQTTVSQNGATGIVIAQGHLIVPSQLVNNGTVVGANEEGLNNPQRKGIIIIEPGYTVVRELPSKLRFFYTTTQVTATEPIEGLYNLNGGASSPKWIVFGEKY
ncbi:hypothetical protein [Thermus phage TSP4]|nr:hypothetical protein [Thermus phage TSP4]